ncbi:MAG: right-handed parallel beta-helix repeat-containing protein [Planctomycetes bacterium]|nr:right-handed parallel beta-helix repeat-containing protein [Planctomycetota bacterium]
MSVFHRYLIVALGVLALLWEGARARAQEISTALPADAALRVSGSVRIAPGAHVRKPSAVPDSPVRAVVYARALRNAVIDLRGVSLASDTAGETLDRARDCGLLLIDCENVTVRGGELRGFKLGLFARNCKGLVIEGLRVESGFSQRLASTAVAADPVDELNRRDNELSEWLSNYGAAIALVGCDGARVRTSRARHAQNGLLLERSSRVQVYDNDFSFLSGWGIALYRSSECVIARNRCDACVRGYANGSSAGGRGSAGQGSAGILLTERCSDNVLAHNFARGCGDGISLFAGLDLVQGRASSRGERAPSGCDRNLLYANDVSRAARNGLELDFSRENRVIENTADACQQHGLAASYCERLTIVENSFDGARGSGVALAHCQDAWIARNVIERCGAGLDVAWYPPSAANAVDAFARVRDTASRDHWVWGNAFAENAADLRIRASKGLCFAENVFEPRPDEGLNAPGLSLADGDPSGMEPRELLRGLGGFLPRGSLIETSLRTPPPAPPEDFTLRERVEVGELPGPAARAPAAPSAIVVGEWGPWDPESGEARPTPRAAGGLLAGCGWDVAWASWRDGADPRAGGAKAWREFVDANAALRAKVDTLTDPWGGRSEARAAVGETRMGLIATARVQLPAGRYVLRAVSDDGVRVRVDGKRVLENWTWHTETADEATLELGAGEHVVEVDYFQYDGGAVLTLDLIAR